MGASGPPWEGAVAYYLSHIDFISGEYNDDCVQ